MVVENDITQLASPLGLIDRNGQDRAPDTDLHESHTRDLPPSMAAVSALPILAALRPSSGSPSGTARSSRSEKPRISALQPRSPANEKLSWLASSPLDIGVPPKVAPEEPQTMKMQKRGPMAGSGHEGYGKYKNLAWETKETALGDCVYRAPWGYRRKSTQHVYSPDESTKHRMSPVLSRGGGSVSGNSDFTDYMPFASSNASPLTSRTSATSVGRTSPQVPSRLVVAVQNTTSRTRKHALRESVSSRNEVEIGGPPYGTAMDTETQPLEPSRTESNETTPLPVDTAMQVLSRPITPLEIVRAVGLAVSPRTPDAKTQTNKPANNRIWHIFPKANRRLQRVHKRSIFKRVRLFFTKRRLLPTDIVDHSNRTPVRWGSHRVLAGHHRSFEALRDIGLTDRPSPSQHIISLQREPVSPISHLQVAPASLPRRVDVEKIDEPQAHELPALPQSPDLSPSEPIHETSSQSRPQSSELDASSNCDDHIAAMSSEDEGFPVHTFPKPLHGHVPADPLPPLAEEEYSEMEELHSDARVPENTRESTGAITFSSNDRAAARESYASSHQSSLYPSGVPQIELETATALSISSSMANLVEDGLVSRSNSRRERELRQASEQLSMIKSRTAKTVFPNLTQMASITAPDSADAPKSKMLTRISSPLKLELARAPSPRPSRLPRRSANSTPAQSAQPGVASAVVGDAVSPAKRIDSPLATNEPVSRDKSRQPVKKKRAPQSSEYITSTKADPLAVANLRYGALITSKWLSFGRVLLSPVDFNPERPTSNRVLVLDGLSKGIIITSIIHFCHLTC